MQPGRQAGAVVTGLAQPGRSQRRRKKKMKSYPIWNKIQACIYKSSKCYGVKNDGLNEILIGTSARNSHSFVRTRVTHKKHEDGSRTYHFYIDDKLYKKATLKKKDTKPLIELVA